MKVKALEGDTVEPRIALDAIDVVWKAGGRAGVTLSGTVMQTMQNVELTITLRE
ncbi:phage baseplate protein [Escherichia coli]